MRQLKKICILIAGILLVSCCFATDIYAQAAEGETQECYTHEFYQKKYTSGCWSCLVLEKLTSAFLKVASAAMPICEKAGHILLIWGFMIWMCFWALKNVASFTEIKGGNILNELLQMAGRVVIAYVCITMGTTAIRQFIITPIMGVGATMAQNFWSDNKSISNYNKALDEYMTDFDWNDTFQPDEPEAAERLEEIMEERAAEDETETETEQEKEPEQISPDSSYEKIVIDLQKAFMAILKKQLGEIQRSCKGGRFKIEKDKFITTSKGACGGSCRHQSCPDQGHRDYIAKHIMVPAGFGESVNHYCQASITAAMKKLHDEVGGSVTKVIKGAVASCTAGHQVGAAAGALATDVQICINGQQNPNIKINIADTVYYNVVRHKNGGGTNVGGGSGHHAVTYAGPNNAISFNGDSNSTLCNNYYYNVTGKVLCLSCMLRAELEKNGINGLNTTKLAELAKSEGNVSYINYEVNSSGGGAFLSNGEESLIVSIPDVKYTGPTDIMPKSIMDSLIGATKAITDTTAQFMVLGNMAMCFSNMKDGGAWDLGIMHLTNVFIWIDGLILLVLGFILTCVVAYYLIDMSFKIGFAVMALPIVMGLWPFKVTQDKLATTISIIAKSAALFAFLALATYYGLELVVASFGGADGMAGIFNDFDKLANETASADEKSAIVDRLEGHFYIFSTKFLMMLFGVIYAYKLISQTTKDLVEKFYPDGAFGSENPMHKMMTGMASIAKNINRKYGTGLVEDIAANSAGKMVKNAAGKTAASTRAAVRAAGGAIRGAIRKIRK